MITARKWVAVEFGGPEVLRNVEVDVPDPRSGQVTIGVRACGINPADAKKLVASLYNQFGFDALDIGGLEESWRVDAGQKAFVTHQNLAQLKENVANAIRP